MSKNRIQFIVIFLGILIIFSFIALIYGMYSKISMISEEKINDSKRISLNLEESEEIIDMKVINENSLLIIINNSGNLKGVIYNVKQHKISEFIEK